MVTIKDVARVAGVSSATVSRALNDSPHISDRTKRKVLQATKELGYIGNAAASVMRSSKSTLLGLIVPDLENDFSVIAKALAECCNEEGFQLVLSVTNEDPEIEREHLRALASARAAGVIIVPTRSPTEESLGFLRQMPCVQLIRRVPDLDSDWIAFDDRKGITEAVDHLLELGHRRIGYIGGSDEVTTGAARLRAFRAALEAAGVPVDQGLVSTGPSDPVRAMTSFIKMYGDCSPSALVTGGNRITVGVIQAIHELGLVVPDDISLVSYGDAAWFKWWGRGMTAVALPIREIALSCGNFLIRKVRAQAARSFDEQTGPYHAVHMPHLVVRDTTGPVGRASQASPHRSTT